MSPVRFVALGLVFGLGACQSMEAVHFQSVPAGAAVATSNGHQCPATPCSIEVPRKEAFTASISKPGFRTAEVPVSTGYGDRGRALLVVNTLVGGVGGALGTEHSGQGYEHTPNPVVVTLQADRQRRTASR